MKHLIEFIKGMLIGIEEIKDGKVTPYELGHITDEDRLENQPEFVIEFNKSLIPKFLFEYQEVLNNKVQPNRRELIKVEYINGWLIFMDLSKHERDEKFIDTFSAYSVIQIEKSFKWIVPLWAELELGNAYKWYVVVLSVLEKVNQKKWTHEAELEMRMKYIKETSSWLEVVGSD